MNLLSSVWKEKCPRCRQGNLFKSTVFSKKFLDMPDNCPVCGQSFNPEPGFYYGAMFISYIGTGFLYLGIIALLIIGFGLSFNLAFGILILFLIITYTKTARLARSVWIHLMIGFDKSFQKN